MDFAAAGLLDDVDGDDRAARIRLLESLSEQGFELDELKAAAADNRLALLPVERVLAGRFTAEEVEEQTGLPAQTILNVRRALGLADARPDEKIFSDADLDAARSIKTFIEAGFSDEAIADITRVLGEGMARLSAASGQAFAQTFLKPGESEDVVARRFAEMAENMTEALEPVLAAAFRAHALDNVRRAMISQAEMAAGQVADEQETSVCFADLVGFTRLGSRVETHALGDVIGTFAKLAAGAAEPPVRLVKTIGDAAMLVSREPGPLVEAALSLIETGEAEELPAVRAGIAWGGAIPRSGDLYGHAVNLASRVTGIARPGSVLCTKEVRDAAPDFDWSFAGTHRLKGIDGSLPLYRAHRGGQASDGQASDGQAKVRRPKAGRSRK
ncbi:MAG: adenylate cyclase regulatory domain-containing protein [Solirubrobacteraceae bacterium]